MKMKIKMKEDHGGHEGNLCNFFGRTNLCLLKDRTLSHNFSEQKIMKSFETNALACVFGLFAKRVSGKGVNFSLNVKELPTKPSSDIISNGNFKFNYILCTDKI